MNDKKFDNIIKGKLDHLSPSERQDIWSSLESKLDIVQPVQTDDAFDNTVKSHLQSHKPHYKSEHWRMLKTELMTIDARKNTVFISKILELAAIFLIVFTITKLPSYFDGDANKKTELFANVQPPEKKVVPKSESSEQAVVTPQSKKPLQQQSQISDVISIDAEKTPLTLNLAEQVSSGQNFTEATDVNNKVFAETSPVANVAVFEDASSSSEIVPESNPADFVLPPQIQSDVVSSNISDADQPGIAVEDPMHIEIPQDRNHQYVDNIAVRDFSVPETEMALIIPLKPVLPAIKSRIGVSFWTGNDVNLINTPFDRFYSVASYKKEALSNAYGVNISKQSSSVEIQSGLAYTLKEYQPKKVNDQYGPFGDNYFEKTLDKITYNLVSIPLNIKYHGLQGNGWSAYLMAGAALNLVVNADYDITERLVKGKPDASRYIPEVARLDSKPFIKGILNGDRFKDNYYVTVGFGFGIEKNIFRNTALYIQPSYFNHILSNNIGIGPNKDKIHTSSLQVGIKTLIN